MKRYKPNPVIIALAPMPAHLITLPKRGSSWRYSAYQVFMITKKYGIPESRAFSVTSPGRFLRFQQLRRFRAADPREFLLSVNPIESGRNQKYGQYDGEQQPAYKRTRKGRIGFAPLPKFQGHRHQSD